MLNIADKKILQKVIIILVVLLFFQFVSSAPVYAIDADVLIEPVTGLFANLGDGIMEIMQKTFLGIETSGAWVEDNSVNWSKILLIAAIVVIAVVSIAGIIMSGGGTLTICVSVAGFLLRNSIKAVIVFHVMNKLHIGENGIYLPDYYLTPEAIFKNEILAFDVNFFKPNEKEEVIINNDYFSVDNDCTVTKRMTGIYADGTTVFKHEDPENIAIGSDCGLSERPYNELYYYTDEFMIKECLKQFKENKDPNVDVNQKYELFTIDRTETDNYHKDPDDGTYLGTRKLS